MTSSAANVAAAQATDLVAGTSLWADAWKRLRRNRMAVASGGVLLVLALACLAGPGLIAATWGYDAETQDLAYGHRPRPGSIPSAPTSTAATCWCGCCRAAG